MLCGARPIPSQQKPSQSTSVRWAVRPSSGADTKSHVNNARAENGRVHFNWQICQRLAMCHLSTPAVNTKQVNLIKTEAGVKCGQNLIGTCQIPTSVCKPQGELL